MSNTGTQEAERVRIFEPSKFNSFYEYAEHVGGGWWLCMRDIMWHNGIEFRIQHLPEVVHPDEARKNNTMPHVEGNVGPHDGMRVWSLSPRHDRDIEMWEAFSRAMNGPLSEYARKAFALPKWSHPHTQFG